MWSQAIELQSQDRNVWPRNSQHHLYTISLHWCPWAVTGEMCNRARVATRCSLASRPLEASQPRESLWPIVMVAHWPCTPETQGNKQVHSHHPERLRLTKPRVLGLEHQSFCNGKSHHRDQHILPNSKICDMGPQAIIRMLLGKPEWGWSQQVFPEQLHYLDLPGCHSLPLSLL